VRRGPGPGDALKPLDAGAWDFAKARHLLFRAGFGGPPAEVEKLRALGFATAVDFLVDYRSQPDVTFGPPDLPPREAPAALAKLGPEEQQKAAQERRRNDQQLLTDVRHWWVRRMVESPRPLEEKMVLFWHGHFANEYRTVRDARALYQQNQLFRKFAVGNFGQLLHAIARDPAMLRYLDNDRNVKGRPNENLAREILELFSMGEGQGYTERDIKEAARALTGSTFDRATGRFRFAARQHDDSPKTIFGQTGNFDGDQLVDLILKQPATARFIARKLFVYFAHEQPDAATIERLAEAFRRSNYEVAPLLKAIFRAEEFYGPKAYAAQIKGPAQLVFGTVRTLPVRTAEPAALAQAMRAMGQDLFEPANVKGWDGGRTWVNSNTLFTRQNLTAALVRGGPAAPGLDLAGRVPAAQARTPAAVVDYLAGALFAAPPAADVRAELIGFLGELPPASAWAERRAQVNARLNALVVLMLSLPEYQLT
jgi:hypothetical protein